MGKLNKEEAATTTIHARQGGGDNNDGLLHVGVGGMPPLESLLIRME